MTETVNRYLVNRGDNLTSSEYWNAKLRDIDQRLAAVEVSTASLAVNLDNLIATSLTELDNTFAPIYADASLRLNAIGINLSTVSTTSATIGLGQKTFVVIESDRARYQTSTYLSVRSQVSSNNAMSGNLVSYDRDTGELVIDIDYLMGTGTFDVWDIMVAAPPDEAFLAHIADMNNPHAVTCAQAGAPTAAQLIDFSNRASANQVLLDSLMVTFAGLLSSLEALGGAALVARVVDLETHALTDEAA